MYKRQLLIRFAELTSSAFIPNLFAQRHALCPESTFGDFYCEHTARSPLKKYGKHNFGRRSICLLYTSGIRPEIFPGVSSTRRERLRLGGRRICGRLGFRFHLSLWFGFLHPFGNEVFLGKIAHLAVELDFIARDLACVFDAEFVVLELQRFNEGDFVFVDLALRDGHVICSIVADADGVAGQRCV